MIDRKVYDYIASEKPVTVSNSPRMVELGYAGCKAVLLRWVGTTYIVSANVTVPGRNEPVMVWLNTDDIEENDNR